MYGEDGKIDKAAYDRLPDSLKNHKDLFAKYDTVESLLTGFANSHSMAMKKALAPLRGDETPDILAERKKQLDTMLNVPTDPKGYGITKPANLPDELWSNEFAGKMAEWGIKNSVSPGAIREAVALLAERTQAEMNVYEQRNLDFFKQQTQTYELEAHKMGLALDKANELVTTGASTLGIDKESPLLRNAEVRLACIRMTNLVAEDRLRKGDDSLAQGSNDPIEQARDIARNPQNPMHKAWGDPTHPDHERVRGHWNDLYRRGKPRQQVSSATVEE